MAFRRPVENRSSPSLGYRLSSDRQPGIEIANNRMPQYANPIERMPFPRPGGQGERFMPPNPMPVPMPSPDRDFDFRRNMPPPIPLPSPMPPPGMGPIPLPSPMPPPSMVPDKFRNYLDRGLRARQGISSLTPSNIGVDRGPTTMDPLQTMLDNPQVMLDAQYARELEEQMDPNNFLTNRMAVGEQFGVDPFGDIFGKNMPMSAPYREEAALDPSDYRTILKILEAGGNPEDYMASTGIMGALPEERQIAELSKPQLDFMKSPMGTPDFYSNYQDYKDAVDAREEKPLFGIFGGQEPATDPEIINKLKETYGTIPFQVPEIV